MVFLFALWLSLFLMGVGSTDAMDLWIKITFWGIIIFYILGLIGG